MDTGLTGRTALVTGSTSGLGLATARLLAAEGANVVLAGRRGDVAEAEAAALPSAIGLGADLTDPEAPARLPRRWLAALYAPPLAVYVATLGLEVAWHAGVDRPTDGPWLALFGAQTVLAAIYLTAGALLRQRRLRRTRGRVTIPPADSK